MDQQGLKLHGPGGEPTGAAMAWSGDVVANAQVRWSDVAIDATNDAVRFRRAMETAFGNG